MKKKILTAGIVIIVIIAAVAGAWYGWRFYSAQRDLKEKNRRILEYADLRQAGDISAMRDSNGKFIAPVDFESLQKENPDIYAWITIPGVVDEPVLQSAKEDTYYMEHGADGESNTEGAVFTESLNARDFSDPLTVLYGNNNEDGSLFGRLFQYRDRQFMEEHPFIYIYTPEKALVYRIFAAYQSDNRHLLMRFNQGTYEGNVRAFIKDILSQRAMDAAVDREADIDTNNQFLTLSTHDPAGEEFRYLVHAYFLEEGV